MICPGCGTKAEPRSRASAFTPTLIDSVGRRWHRDCAVTFLGAHDLKLEDLRAYCSEWRAMQRGEQP